MPGVDDVDRETLVVRKVTVAYGDTIVRNPRSTIVPDAGSDTATRGAVAMLERLYGRTGVGGKGDGDGAGVDESVARGVSFETAYRVGEPIGLGGMGMVREAEQTSLARHVALKSLRQDRRSPTATLELLREAWIAGSLDHPNVVPVHDIVIDHERNPVIVLKRIDGVCWTEVMHDADRVRERFAAEDLLDWNLSILVQVLNAIRFAHSRGILHRDIKPDNVMIGDFGEVYLLDWGLAVSLVADGSGRLPLAEHATEMAGTPCYLAPEMLGEGGAPLSERTDVYLCGATLYEIVVGRAPHEGPNLMTIIKRVLASEPEIPADVPTELAAICRRAMAAEPDDRFASVDEMRAAIRDFVEHRGAARLAEEATRALDELEEALGAVRQGTVEDRDAMDGDEGSDVGEGASESAVAQRERLYRLFGACRFGFHQALLAWPENPTAQTGMRRAIVAMIEYELGRGQPHAAAALHADLREDAPEVRARIDQALRDEEDARERIARMAEHGRAFDISVRARERTLAAVTMVTVFTLVPLFFIWRHGTTTYDSHGELALWNAGYLSITLVVGVVFWRGLAESAINRRFFFMVVFLFLGNGALEFGLWRAGVSAEHTLLVHIFLWFFTTGAVFVMLDRRFWLAMCGYLLAFIAFALDSGANIYVVTVPHGILAINIVYLWNPTRRDA